MNAHTHREPPTQRTLHRLLHGLGLVIVALVLLWGAAAPTGAGGHPHPVVLASAETAGTAALRQDGDFTVYLPYITNGNGAPPVEDDFATQVVALTNAERAKVGCPPLQISAQLTAAAQRHSDDMALNDFFDHIGSDGSSPADRVNDTGYLWWRVAENIAAGYPTPETVVDGWMNSDGHRANIENCALIEIGVGYTYIADDPGDVPYHHYWTQDFATPRD